MWYEINVSLNGRHFFATHARSIVSYEQLKVVYATFKEKFKESEGYELSVTEYSTVGKSVEISV